MLVRFFSSLKPGIVHVEALRLYLSDFIHPVSLETFNKVLCAIGRSGCTSFYLHSCEDYPANLILDEDDVEAFGDTYTPLQAKVLDIESSILYSKELSPWLVRTLRASPMLEALHLSSEGLHLHEYEWSDFLQSLHFPALLEFSVEGLGLRSVAAFMSRHQSVRKINLDGLVDDARQDTPQFSLPNLRSVIGEGRSLAAFFRLLTPLSIHLTDVSFQGDRLADTFTSFDLSAHTTALWSLGDHVQHGTIGRLSISFPSPYAFTEPFFRWGAIRPEHRLNVDTIDIQLRCASTFDCRDLLVSAVFALFMCWNL